MGVEPSEHTSITVVASRVSQSPPMVAPNQVAKASSGINARMRPARIRPNIDQRMTTRAPAKPSRRISALPLSEKRMLWRNSCHSCASGWGSPSCSCQGLGGSWPRLTSESKIRPVTIPITSDSRINNRVQLTPIKPNRISVSENEFQGLANRKAMTWPTLAPRS